MGRVDDERSTSVAAAEDGERRKQEEQGSNGSHGRNQFGRGRSPPPPPDTIPVRASKGRAKAARGGSLAGQYEHVPESQGDEEDGSNEPGLDLVG